MLEPMKAVKRIRFEEKEGAPSIIMYAVNEEWGLLETPIIMVHRGWRRGDLVEAEDVVTM